MTAVYIARCADYDRDSLQAAVQETVDGLGGLAGLIRPGWRVLLKPNLLRPAAPEQGVSTHPELVRAVAQLVLDAGATPVIADSPGGPHNRAYLAVLYRQSGMHEVARELGIDCNDDMRTTSVSNLDGDLLKGVEMLAVAAEADAIINLPKLKTHSFTLLSGAVKNLFGVIPGMGKTAYHAKLQTAHEFSRMLVDLALVCKPVITIMDGVLGMEGNGPSAGDVRRVGVILGSTDDLALDVVAAALVGMDPQQVPPLAVATARGLTTGRLEDVELRGLPLEQARLDPPFRLPTAATARRGPSILGAISRVWPGQVTKPYPVANADCTACRTCVRACPVKAITIENGRARMATNLCIQCYCCHELCPYHAIDLQLHWLGRLLTRSTGGNHGQSRH
ncbi:MAG: DUF362 domain-containing protein [Chloroflexi bacterium]|nr:DUF362 domain-containing protein [Chloroflexota bacterium]